jgi:hypothetical protein
MVIRKMPDGVRRGGFSPYSAKIGHFPDKIFGLVPKIGILV